MSSTPYFTSRQRSSYTRPSPSVQAAAHGNKNELLRALVGPTLRTVPTSGCSHCTIISFSAI